MWLGSSSMGMGILSPWWNAQYLNSNLLKHQDALSSPIGRFRSLLSCWWKGRLQQPTILLQCGAVPLPSNGSQRGRHPSLALAVTYWISGDHKRRTSSYSLLRVSHQTVSASGEGCHTPRLVILHLQSKTRHTHYIYHDCWKKSKV